MPYSDCFHVISREVVKQLESKKVEVTYLMKIVWVKKTIMEGTIRKSSYKENIETFKNIIFPGLDEAIETFKKQKIVRKKTVHILNGGSGETNID